MVDLLEQITLNAYRYIHLNILYDGCFAPYETLKYIYHNAVPLSTFVFNMLYRLQRIRFSRSRAHVCRFEPYTYRNIIL